MASRAHELASEIQRRVQAPVGKAKVPIPRLTILHVLLRTGPTWLESVTIGDAADSPTRI